MEIGEWLTIIAIISGPLTVFFLEKWWRRKEWKRRRKEELVYNLVGGRAGTKTVLNAKEMEKALNAIPVIFSDNQEVMNAYQEYYQESSRDNPDNDLATEKLVSLILTVCREMGFSEIEESTVKNFQMLHENRFS